MADKKFNIIFSGKLAEGSKPAEVLQRLCVVLQLDTAQVRALFKSGAGAVICKELCGSEAYDMQEKIQIAGVLCTLKELEAPAQEAFLSPPPIKPLTESRHHPQDLKPRWQPPSIPQKKEPGIISLVVKLVMLAMLAYGGWKGYQNWLAPPSPAFTAYVGFAEAIAKGEYQKAADSSEGEAKAYAESWIQMGKPTTMNIYGKSYSMSPPSVSSIAGDVAWIKQKHKVETKKTDNVVELQAEQTVCRIPPGVSSALCKWPVTFLHDVEVQLVGGTWKVSGFKETRLTPMDK